jgi:hypothetical protein
MLTWILSLKTPALVLYVFWCIGISSFALGSFATIIQEYLAIQYDYSAEALMVMGQVGFQWLFMAKCSWLERKGYAIIALTVSMIGSLLILPLVAYHNFFTTSSVWATVYFFIVVGVIFVIHHRLVVRKKLPTILTYTWVLYRLSLLIYLVFPVQRSL